MTNNVKKLPRPTVEIIREYDEVSSDIAGLDPSWDEDEANATLHKWLELENSYDWSNIEFTDPATGKKGLKNVKGELMVPALYDSFPSPGTYIDHWERIVAVLDGKYGILENNGYADVILPFEYDCIIPTDNWDDFTCRKDNHEEVINISGIDNEGSQHLQDPTLNILG